MALVFFIICQQLLAVDKIVGDEQITGLVIVEEEIQMCGKISLEENNSSFTLFHYYFGLFEKDTETEFQVYILDGLLFNFYWFCSSVCHLA